MSNSVQPHGQQTMKLPCPWDSPGKNTGVGCISFSNACMHAKSLQLCPILCDPKDSSPPGSSVHRVLQARILEWVGISFSSFRDYFDTNIATLCFFWLIFASFISSFSLFCLLILDLFNTSLMSPLNILLYFLYTIFAHL